MLTRSNKEATPMNAFADQTALRILARAEELGYDPTRVAIALGIDSDAHRPPGQHGTLAQPEVRKTAATTNADAAPPQ